MTRWFHKIIAINFIYHLCVCATEIHFGIRNKKKRDIRKLKRPHFKTNPIKYIGFSVEFSVSCCILAIQREK